jgi:hypothetical protein
MLPTSDETGPDPSAPEEPLPERIGRYRILARLGAGGMGTVYQAQDRDLDRTVALKLPHFTGSPHDRAVRIQRFQREARAAARVWHPHVCPIYDVGEHEGQPYVVMAYVEGRSLAEHLAGRKRCEDPGQAVALVRQVLDALDAVHGHGIVHRDLKPGNIMLDPAGRAILMDFGLARPGDDAGQLTSEGVVLGTPAYMAPEQAAGQSEEIGPWTDLYSVGVILYQLLTGRLPFEGPPLTVLSRIVHDAPPPPSGLRPGLDPALEAVVLRALAKAPEDRYQSARDFAAALPSPSGSTTSSAPPSLAGAATLPLAAAPVAGPRGGEGATRAKGSSGRSLMKSLRTHPLWAVVFVAGIALLILFANLFQGSSTRRIPTESELRARLDAALKISNVSEKDATLDAVAADAAQAGAGPVVKDSISAMQNVGHKDQTAAACAPVLAKAGRAKDAVEVGNLIQNPALRDQVLASVAKGGR